MGALVRCQWSVPGNRAQTPCMFLRHRGIANGKSVIAGLRSDRVKGQSNSDATNLKELPSPSAVLRVRESLAEAHHWRLFVFADSLFCGCTRWWRDALLFLGYL